MSAPPKPSNGTRSSERRGRTNRPHQPGDWNRPCPEKKNIITPVRLAYVEHAPRGRFRFSCRADSRPAFPCLRTLVSPFETSGVLIQRLGWSSADPPPLSLSPCPRFSLISIHHGSVHTLDSKNTHPFDFTGTNSILRPQPRTQIAAVRPCGQPYKTGRCERGLQKIPPAR